LGIAVRGEDSRSIADVVDDIVGNVQTIIRSEVRLAKTEITEEARKAGRAAGLLAGGGVAGLFTAWLLLLAFLFALATIMPMWGAALLLFVIMAAFTVALVMAGRKRFKTVHPKPEKTIESVKENVAWVKSQTK
jgi:Flp pilus assembly protein TadB